MVEDGFALRKVKRRLSQLAPLDIIPPPVTRNKTGYSKVPTHHVLVKAMQQLPTAS
jgi:hypothetical protein